MRGVVILSAVLILCLSRFASAACNTNSECLTAAAPYCFNQTCLGCLVNAHCRASEYCTNAGICAARPSCGQCNYANAPFCSSSKCVQCKANSDCASGVCDAVVKVCRPPVSCATNATVCAGTDRPVCSSAGSCVECLSNSDCSAAFPTCTTAGVCTAKVLEPLFLCSKNSTTANKRTLYTAFQATQNNINVVYPVGSRNALYVVGKETVLLNSLESFQFNTTRAYFYPQSFEQIDIDTGAQVTWYLDGVISTLTLDATSDCPTNVTFFVSISNLTFVAENLQNVTDTVANALGVDSSRVDIVTNTQKRSTQQAAGLMQVTVTDGADVVLATLSDPTAVNSALTNLGLVVSGVQGATLSGESTPTPDGASPPYSAPSAAPSAVNPPVDVPAGGAPTDVPMAAPSTNVVPITPVATFQPTTDNNNPNDVVAPPGSLDSGIIVAIVVVCVVVAAAVIIIAVVVSRNKKKKSGGGSGSSRMERGSATEMKETTSTAALVTTTNPAKKAESESSDEDEESGEDVDSSDEDEESEEEEESGSEVSGSGSNEGSSAEGSGSNEGSDSGSGSEESS